MDLGIFAKTFTANSLEELLDKLTPYGFVCVQFNMQCAGLEALPLEIPTAIAKNIGSIFQKKEVSMTAVSGTFNMIHPDPSLLEQGLKSFDLITENCALMGTKIVTLCTGSRNAKDKWAWHADNDSPEAWNALLQTMEKVLLKAEEQDIFVGVEPEMANVINSPKKALDLIQIMQSNRIKIILDPANLFEKANRSRIRDKIKEAIDLLFEHIAIVHAKDRTEDGYFKAAGQGAVDFPYLIANLKQMNYQGPVILHGLREDEVTESVSMLKQLI